MPTTKPRPSTPTPSPNPTPNPRKRPLDPEDSAEVQGKQKRQATLFLDDLRRLSPPSPVSLNPRQIIPRKSNKFSGNEGLSGSGDKKLRLGKIPKLSGAGSAPGLKLVLGELWTFAPPVVREGEREREVVPVKRVWDEVGCCEVEVKKSITTEQLSPRSCIQIPNLQIRTKKPIATERSSPQKNGQVFNLQIRTKKPPTVMGGEEPVTRGVFEIG